MTPSRWCCPVESQIFNSSKGKPIYQKELRQIRLEFGNPTELPSVHERRSSGALHDHGNQRHTEAAPAGGGQPARRECAAATRVIPAQLHGLALEGTRGSHTNVAERREWGYLSSAHVCLSYASTRSSDSGSMLIGKSNGEGFFSMFLC